MDSMGKQGRAARGWAAGLLALAGVGLAVPVHASEQGRGGRREEAREAPVCRPVSGTIVTTFVACPEDFASPPEVGLCTAGQVALGHGLQGSTRFRALALAPAAGQPEDPLQVTVLSYAGELEVTTPLGVLLLSDVGVVDNAAGTFTEVDQVVASGGRLAGVGGTLFMSGAVTATGFSGSVSGRLCPP